MKKYIYIISGVIIIGLSVYFIFFNGSDDSYTFRFEKASKGNIAVYVTATGTVNPVTSVDVGTQVSGIISKLYADFNSIVKAGQIIAQIDPTFLNQAIKDAEANLEHSQAQYDEYLRTYQRTKALYDKKLDSQADYDAALSDYESSKALLKQAQVQLDKAKLNLEYATIYAPIDGVVINRAVSIGQTVAASFSSPTLFTIANDLKKMQVEAVIDESDIGKISIGQPVSFTVDAYPDDEFYGKVSQIRLSPQIVSNVVNYSVIIDVPNDRLKLMPGMTANVKVLIAKKDSVLQVPNLALRFQPPPELVDSAALKEIREKMRSRFRNRNTEGNDNKMEPGSSNGRTFADRGTVGNSERRNGFGNPGFDRTRIKAIRDSIIAAHGGNLSEEDLRKELRSVFEKAASSRKPKPVYEQVDNVSDASAGKYAIISRYPQYEKSSYQPYGQIGMGRIWVLNSRGKLDPVFVRTGLNDGRMTEIIGGTIKDGANIVISASSDNGDAQQGSNPFMQRDNRFRGGFRGR